MPADLANESSSPWMPRGYWVDRFERKRQSASTCSFPHSRDWKLVSMKMYFQYLHIPMGCDFFTIIVTTKLPNAVDATMDDHESQILIINGANNLLLLSHSPHMYVHFQTVKCV